MNKKRYWAYGIIGVLQAIFATNMAVSAEAYSEAIQQPPEYTEVQSDGGLPIVLKRDLNAKVTVQPLVCTYFNTTVSGTTVAVGSYVVA